MFDIRRIRERAADWLGDVGGAALVAAGEVVSILGQRLRGDEPSADTPPPSGQDHAPHPPGVERRPRDPEAIARLDALFAAAPPEWQELFSELDRRDPKMQAPAAEPAVKPSHNAEPGALGEAREVGICSRPRCPEGDTLRAMGRPCPCGAELRPVGFTAPPDPFVIITPEALAAGPAQQAIGGLNLIASEGKRIGWPHGERKPVALADLGLTAADLARMSPTPPPGPWRGLVARAQAETPADLCAIAAEATRATDGATPALGADREERLRHIVRTLRDALPSYAARSYEPSPTDVITDIAPAVLMMLDVTFAGIEEQRLSHGGCTRLPTEMLDALGVKDGDLVWFLRSTPGGRWEAWTAPELDAQFCIGQDLGPELVAARKAAVDAMPFHVASRLTTWEARRLEAKGVRASVWWADDCLPYYESDAGDMARLRRRALGEEREADEDVVDPVPADAPPLECQFHPTELDTSCALCAFPADRATPPVASAAERAPESPSGGAGAPWRGVKHDVRRGYVLHDIWIAQGDRYVARFDGPRAEERAREYAALMSEPAAPVACGTVALQGTEAARTTLVDPAPPRIYAEDVSEPGLRPGTKRMVIEPGARVLLDAAPPALPKPDAVRWSGQAAMVARLCSCPGVAAPQDGDEVDSCDACGLWRAVKPSRVDVGQRWRCVGVEGELVVRWRYEDGVSVRLGPAEDEASGKVVARISDMLGLREWSYLGGAR